MIPGRSLANLPQPELLHLSQITLPGIGLTELVKLRTLQALDIGSAKVDDKGAKLPARN
jgi:hypothetical protein